MDDNPLESGLLFTCKLKTDTDFLGRAALEVGIINQQTDKQTGGGFSVELLRWLEITSSINHLYPYLYPTIQPTKYIY